MSVVPGFKYDLFISYAHLNDHPWGWVTEFIETLKAELESKSRDFTIWWDPALRTGEVFDVAIADAISNSAVFLSILSLAYGNSTYCRREVEEFRQGRHPTFPMMVGSMSRMQAIVLEAEYTQDQWPPEIRRTSPQPFFDKGNPLFSRPQHLSTTDAWVQALWKVRDSIWALLTDMRKQKEKGAAIERSYGLSSGGLTSRPVLCLAEVTDDLYRRRENLRTALLDGSGFQVATWAEPTPPPASGPNSLSVYLFGKYSGRAYGTADFALPRLQLEETLRAKPARRPLVWLARDLDLAAADTEEHGAFLRELIASNEVEVLRTDFEDLKDELARRMQALEAPAPKATRTPRESPIVHIWHSLENPSSLQPLKSFLSDNDCGISVFDCASTPPEKMQSRLAVCDGLIVPYTAETRAWAEDIMMEAFRLRRREERPTAFAAVELPPATDGEFNFEHPRVVPVRVLPPQGFENMSGFLLKLEAAGA